MAGKKCATVHKYLEPTGNVARQNFGQQVPWFLPLGSWIRNSNSDSNSNRYRNSIKILKYYEIKYWNTCGGRSVRFELISTRSLDTTCRSDSETDRRTTQSVCLADNKLSYNRLLHRKITIYDIGLRTPHTAFACQHVSRSATPHYATPLGFIERE